MTTATTDEDAGLPIQEVARRTGFSESALRYYERIGLIDPVPRDTSSSHRRYAEETVDTLEALACLRSMGMSIEDMRSYLDGVAEGRSAAPQMVELFAGRAERLEDELAALRLRHAYATAKVALGRPGSTTTDLRSRRRLPRCSGSSSGCATMTGRPINDAAGNPVRV